MAFDKSITFMGTGSSIGTPALGCTCPVCRSGNSKNNRTRPGICISWNGRNVLVDVTPDFRAQALKNKISHFDAVLLTHAHADHILGLDDLRIVTEFSQTTIPVYGSRTTLEGVGYFFDYLFQQKIWRSGLPRLNKMEIESERISLFDLDIEAIEVFHDTLPVTGYRFGDVAYVTDFSQIPKMSLEKLKNLKLLIISAIRRAPHPKHLALDEVVAKIQELSPRKALLTHLSHELEHEELIKMLPENISPAYDGMVINI